MNSNWIQLAIFAALLVAWIVFQRRGRIPSADAKALVAKGALLCDVRSPGEFASGHLPGAVNIPVGELKARVGELGDKSKPVIVYCASGARSAMARSSLKGMGFTEVFNLGSIANW